MSNAYVIGAGMTRFGRHPERGIESLAVEAIIAALGDAQLEWREVQQM
jgi:acetyl-CoA acetyltransferase